ncbi:MAG TPA: selenium cofactor biosynthesis protein YqeC [Brevefilum sp.]|nr:selenium cofactor biosynthesis protein YqeC [Brevefilum sp.]HOR18864.1 selenium cofactor biosynthesis protein YqeC [Brevefilum sp.]HPL69672.1 selenium cofactor biosynthesis protein YqeC [Brevefilum sp.]
MNLRLALGLTGVETIAFTGAGGKTSAMATLAMELPPPVVMITTTHLGKWQEGIAQQHIIITSPDALKKSDLLGLKTILVTGPPGKDERWGSLNPESLEKLSRICRENEVPLLIEADGARQCPLKAPADYEPVIPSWVDRVVVMAGLGGLRRRLSADTVHRPELFSQIAGLAMGEEIKVEHVERVLRSTSGGLKGTPVGARRILFLNQAEDSVRKAQGNRLANALEDVYQRVLIGSLAQPEADGPVFSAHSQTAGIILAAGGSERLGVPKQFLDWCGKPFIVQVAQTALTAGLSPMVVVTGARQTEIETGLANLPVRCVYNPEWASGQASSLKVGLKSLPDHCDCAMFLLSDQPQITSHLVRQLIERHHAVRAPITAPMIRERRGNPVLFARQTFGALREVSGDQGGRAIFNAFKVDYLPWVDERAQLDVDQDSDLNNLIEQYFGGQAN